VIKKLKYLLIIFSIILIFSCKKQIYDTDVLKISWCKISEGNFWMGTKNKDRWRLKNEKPKHAVYLDSFYISKHEITNRQYDVFCKDTGKAKSSYHRPGRDECPVNYVSWFDAMEFCDWLSKKTGEEITLPTEAQWEKACRAGTSGDTYFYKEGGGWNPVNYPKDYRPSRIIVTTAWFSYNSDDDTHPVGQLKPNQFGIYDMLGNVWEWCYDWFDEDYYSISSKKNPKGSSKKQEGHGRVIRGGCYSSPDLKILRCAYRIATVPTLRVHSLGFRIVKNIKKKENQ
jgi:sulfatase modifying factor 1